MPRAVSPCAVFAVRDSAPFGIRRRSGFRALRDSAPFGIPRSSGFRALRDSALFGIPRPSGFRAVRDSAPFGIWRRSAPAHFATLLLQSFPSQSIKLHPPPVPRTARRTAGSTPRARPEARLARQRLREAALALGEVRGGVPARRRDRVRRAHGSDPVLHGLQSAPFPDRASASNPGRDRRVSRMSRVVDAL